MLLLNSTGPLSYIVKLPNGTTGRCHQDQLKSCREQVTAPTQLPDTVPPDLLTVSSTIPPMAANLQTSTSVPHRYPQRIRRPPTRYNT